MRKLGSKFLQQVTCLQSLILLIEKKYRGLIQKRKGHLIKGDAYIIYASTLQVTKKMEIYTCQLHVYFKIYLYYL